MPTLYQWEPLIRLLCYDDLARITQEHWAAIALDRDDVPLVIDWELYLSAERAGTWRAFTARSDGVLVGYIAFQFQHPARYRTTMYVQEDTIWVIPGVGPLRRALIWRGLWKHALAELNVLRGQSVAKVSGKIRLDAASAGLVGRTLNKRIGPARVLFAPMAAVLRSLGLRPVELIMSRVLK